MNLLLVDSSREAHLAAVKLAKQFYGADPYNRHLLCVQYKFEKEWASQLLDLLSIILQSLMKHNVHNVTMLQKIQSQAELLETTATNLLTINGNPKIHLAKLCEQL